METFKHQYIMFDSVTFSLNKENFDVIRMNELFQKKFSFESETQYPHSKSHHRYYLNWSFWLTEKYLNFSGSLTNLILGNSIENATHEDIKAALAKLEDILEIPLNKAKIRRIDISGTFNVEHEVSRYLEILLPPKNFSTIVYGHYETLEMVQKGVSISKFYDKVKEQKDKKKVVLINVNKLRYELHVPKNVSKFFKMPILCFGDLLDEGIYAELIKKWRDSFFCIPIKENFKPLRLNTTSSSSFFNSLAMEAVALRGGFDAIDAILRNPSVDRKVRSDIRKSIKKRFIYQPEISTLKDELNDKVEKCYMMAIEFLSRLKDVG